MEIKIKNCSNRLYWYNQYVGQTLHVEKFEKKLSSSQGIPENVFWCRPIGGGPLNFVLESDAEEIGEKSSVEPKKLTKRQKEIIGEYITKTYSAMEYLNILYEVLGLEPEGKLPESFHAICELSESLLGELIGEDALDWVQWHVLENKFGAKGLKAGVTGDMKPIKNLDDLFFLIDIWRK